LATAESVLLSTPSRASQDEFEDSTEGEEEIGSQRDSQGHESPIFSTQDDELRPFELIERETMLEEAQKRYANILMPLKDTTVQHVGHKNKSLHVVMPRNEKHIATAQDYKATSTHPETLAHLPSRQREMKAGEIAVPSSYRMSVNILRPFESIVDVAQRYCASPGTKIVRKTRQHATPVAVMFASASLMN
jgi:hypothetical protein